MSVTVDVIHRVQTGTAYGYSTAYYCGLNIKVSVHETYKVCTSSLAYSKSIRTWAETELLQNVQGVLWSCELVFVYDTQN